MHCNHLVYNDSSILGGGAFIGNHVYKALKVKCTCAMHVYVNNSYNLNIYATWYGLQKGGPSDTEA